MFAFVFKCRVPALLAVLALAIVTYFFAYTDEPVDYSLQVKPIINKRCIACHGGVRKKGGFSFLFREEALAKTESGKLAIVPFHPEESEMIRRINLSDPDARMPYRHDPLPKSEIDLLTKWIEQGAKWGEHWAYVPVKEQLPPAADKPWIRNDIDRFILDRLNKEGLTPSPDADGPTLLRRVSLDLTGIPAKETLAKKYLANPSDEQYEELVDSLLATPAFGERWTSMWMDLSRYADSKGYEKDTYRNIWRYRDWMIKAFNEDKPYDQFLTEQLAGDLISSEPSDDQLIATAFHRNSMTNDEGGTDNEEFRTAAVLDRVNTTWEVLMGTTFQCVQCHSHPYDPFKHEEYYKFMAFFNNSRDADTPGDYPLLREYQKEDSAKLIEVREWLIKNTSPEKSREQYAFLKTGQPVYYSITAKAFGNAIVSEWSLLLRKNGGGILRHVDLTDKINIIFPCYSPLSGGVLSIRADSERGELLATIPMSGKKEWQTIEKEIKPLKGFHDLYFYYTNASLRDMDETAVLFDWFHFDGSFPGKGQSGYSQAKATSWQLLTKGKFTSTPIMMENPENMFRATHVFERGNWMSKGEQVVAGVPHIFNPMPAGAPNNRLGLSKWLTDKKNPLVSRTLVNRLWEQLYGAGIVETVEDLGSQGIAPSHRELLDHLSWEFMTTYKWSIKTLLKEMVMSSTYRQDSKSNPDLTERDPFNKLYARGPRVRLTAEQLRDQSLTVSGLLSNKMYGPSVMPYQPTGIWLSPYNGEKWRRSEKGDQHRRALYTYWKRTAPYPSMLTFDGGAREVCVSRRIRTNTPLQALVTLNDSTFFEMAGHLANRMSEQEGDAKARIGYAYQLMMYKPITNERLDALLKLYNNVIESSGGGHGDNFRKVNNASGEESPESLALTVVANAMLNMDEWITKN